MSDFAQIPTALISRFASFSKTEIIVVCYLYACRNRRTGICNPSQRHISEATHLDKSQVSKALKSLIENRTILKVEEGFKLTDLDDKKVDDSSTSEPVESCQIVNSEVDKSSTFTAEKVVKSTTKVDESSTESCQIVNSTPYSSLNRGIEHRKNIEGEHTRTSPLSPRDFAPPIGPTLRANHPALVAVRNLTNHQPDRATWEGLIDVLGIEPDLAKLAACYSAWVMKSYRKSNYGWITDWYVNGIPAQQRQNNGKSQANPRQTASERNVERIVANRNLAERFASGELDEAVTAFLDGPVPHPGQDPKPRQLAAHDREGELRQDG